MTQPADTGVVLPGEITDVPQVARYQVKALTAVRRDHVQAARAGIVDIDATDVSDARTIGRKPEMAQLAYRTHLIHYFPGGCIDHIYITKHVGIIDQGCRGQCDGITFAIS